MSEAYKPAGTYELVSFKIYTIGNEANAIEIKNLIHVFSIEESMLRGSVRGNAKVYDGAGVYYNLPIRGQEVAEITYKDYYDLERTEKYFIYAVTDIRFPKKAEDTMLEYTLQFVSYGKFWSDRYVIRRTIAKGSGITRKYLRIDEQAQILFDDYFKSGGQGTDKVIEIPYETTGEQQLIIPALTPEDAMHFLSRRAFKSESEMNLFRFYETREKYYFIDVQDRSFDASSEMNIKFFYTGEAANVTPEAENRKMLNIISLQFGDINTTEEMKNGGYYRKTVEVDFINRQLYPHPYEHLDRYQEFIYPDGEGIFLKPRLTDEYINEHANYWHRTYVIKDYPDSDRSNASGLRPQPYYSDIYNNKGSSVIHFNNTKLYVKVFGTNRQFPGNVIELSLPKFKQVLEIDDELSGKYMIESINNIFYENSFIQELTLIKGGRLGQRPNTIDTSARNNGNAVTTQTTPAASPRGAEDFEGFLRDIGGNSVPPPIPTGGGPG
jgi:hypothetical protein